MIAAVAPHPNFRKPAHSRYDWSKGGRLVRDNT